MSRYGIEKYQIEIRQHPDYLGVETIATSTYAGKPVFGKAICRVEDTYNEDYGIRLAAARCAAKIAKKRLKRAEQVYTEAVENYRHANKRLTDMAYYYGDAHAAVYSASAAVDDILQELN